MSERHALRVIGMSASALRYAPAADRNASLRQAIETLAYRHRRYGAAMSPSGRVRADCKSPLTFALTPISHCQGYQSTCTETGLG